MTVSRRKILLAQLPIPLVGPQPIKGNVPLAAAYLKMYARNRGLEESFEIDLFPPPLANTLGDLALVDAILAREPWLVGFTCYLWNIDRTLWVADEIKRRQPDVRIIIGGPEVTADNDWVLKHPAIDYAAIGEGEQTFSELLFAFLETGDVTRPIDGLYVAARTEPEFRFPKPRKPLPNLNEISSPYLEGILDAADERMLLLETIRGCIFKCKFCYYPKSYDDLYFVSREKIVANLEHARRRGVEEVVLLDPTLNQRRDFAAFLRLLAECNPDGQFTYFGELRAEGINADIAKLLRAANFSEVEIGLQSIDPIAMELMDRNNNLKAFERGARALLDEGIRVKVDLIIGLPGDTVASVRRGMHYLRDSGLYTDVQVFNLAILPGTAFRQEAETLGLAYQSRTPYYVLNTPTLRLEQMYDLMAEAEDLFEREFDPLPQLELPVAATVSGTCTQVPDTLNLQKDSLSTVRLVDLDNDARRWSNAADLDPARQSLVFTLWFRGTHLHDRAGSIAAEIEQLLSDNPHTTLQIILEPTGEAQNVTPDLLAAVAEASFRETSYLDRFYSVLPGRPKGAKRIFVLLAEAARGEVDEEWLTAIEEFGEVAWRDAAGELVSADESVSGSLEGVSG